MTMRTQLTTGICDFLASVEGVLDVSSDVSRSATAHLLQVVVQRADPDDFMLLSRRLRGIELLLENLSGDQDASAANKTRLHGLNAPGSLAHIANLQSLGVPMHDISLLVAMFLGFIKQSCDPGVGKRILESVPELRILSGELA